MPTSFEKRERESEVVPRHFALAVTMMQRVLRMVAYKMARQFFNAFTLYNVL